MIAIEQQHNDEVNEVIDKFHHCNLARDAIWRNSTIIEGASIGATQWYYNDDEDKGYMKRIPLS